MYLTKLDLERSNRRIQVSLADCQQLHRLVMGLFETDRKSSRVLYRLRMQDRELALYLYSDCPINQARLLPGMRFSGNESYLVGWRIWMRDRFVDLTCWQRQRKRWQRKPGEIAGVRPSEPRRSGLPGCSEKGSKMAFR